MNTGTTKQGVRNLNAKGYNGKKPQCDCRRDPQTPTRPEYHIRMVEPRDATGRVIGPAVPKNVAIAVCVFCGTERE